MSHTSRELALGPVTLRNRIASAPMERNYCDADGHLTELYRHYLRQRADAGVALVMTEAGYVRADGKGRASQLGIHDDSCIEGLRALADEIHERGALLGCQLNHGGGTTQTATSGLPTVAPSAVGVPVAGGQVPRALETHEVYELVADFAAAASRCVAAGVDVLSIHAGHGYLVHQFMSPLSNHRSDEFRDPVLFLNLVVDAVRKAAPGVALGLRLSVIEGVEGGLDAKQTLTLIERVRHEYLDFLDLSAGSYAAGEWIVQSGEWRPGFLGEYARPYRRFGKPLGMAGRLNSPEIVEEVLADGNCDYVSLARALHADPAFATACLDGSSYRPCIACNVCIDSLGLGSVGCTVNPTVGRGRVLLPTPVVRAGTEVTVVGAGPAGLTAARELAIVGAKVTVIEKRDHVGGDMALAAGMKSTPDFHRMITWSRAELERLGVTVRLGVDAAGDETVRDADAVIAATGGTLAAHPVSATESTPLIDAAEWLANRDMTVPLPACTVWGADTIGMALADTLAAEGTAVLLIGGEREIAPLAGRRGKILAVPRLRDNPAVRIHLGVELLEVGDSRVRVRGEGAGETQWLEAPGPVLVSQGTRAPESPSGWFEDIPIVREAIGVGTLRDAVLGGYDVAREVAAHLA